MESENLAELIEWSDGTEECLGRLKKKVSAYEDIVIFGAGIGGRETLELLQKMDVGRKVRAFSDNNNKIDSDYMELPVIKPERIKNEFKNFLVIISSTAFDVIQKQLTELIKVTFFIFSLQGFPWIKTRIWNLLRKTFLN